MIGDEKYKYKNYGEYVSKSKNVIIIKDNFFKFCIENDVKTYIIKPLDFSEILSQEQTRLEIFQHNYSNYDYEYRFMIYEMNWEDCVKKILGPRIFENGSYIVSYYNTRNIIFLLLHGYRGFFVSFKDSNKYFAGKCFLVKFTSYEIVLKFKNFLIIYSPDQEMTYFNCKRFISPEKNYIPSTEKVNIVCKNQEKIQIEKSFIQLLKSDFLNSQLENGDEIHIPLFESKDINISNFEFLNYIGSGIIQKCKEYINFSKI